MSKLSLRLSTLLLGLLTAACSDRVVAPAALLRAGDALRSNSSNNPYQIDASAVTLRVGGSQQLNATKTANGQVVPEPSVTWSTSNASVATVSATGLVTAVAPGQAVVSANRGSHQVDVAITVTDPCAPVLMSLGVTTGSITAQDCYFAPSNRFSNYYWFPTTMGEIIKVQSAGLNGLTGVKENTTDPATGVVFGSRSIGAPYRVIANGDPVQLFVSDINATIFGSYSVTRTDDSQAHVCGGFTFVMPGATFTTPLNATNACAAKVQFSPIPAALGHDLLVQDYLVKLDAGKSYTITLSGLSSSFDPALTVYTFSNSPVIVAQNVPGPLPAAPTRSITFTPAATGYFDIEVASGRFVDNLVTWVTQTGTFTMTVSR